MSTEEQTLSQSEEEYLESIYKLTRKGRPARTDDIATAVGVSPPAASGMMRRLAARGALRYVPYGGAELTASGEEQALRVVRRHRLIERLLTDVLKIPWDAVHDQACRLEHAIMPSVEAKIEEAIGGVDTCPHGQPIPTPEGRVDVEDARALPEVEPGTRVRIARVTSEAAEFLRYLSCLGLLPRVEILVEAKAPFDGPIMVRVGDAHYALGRDVAASIMVSPVA
ncbi:MAG: metal-dependent transcriptional regulator [Chloroflexota bacterium]